MKHGGSSRRRQAMEERDAALRNKDAQVEQAPPIETAPISTDPGTTDVGFVRPVADTETGELGITSIGSGSDGDGEVSTTAVGVGQDNGEGPSVTSTEQGSDELGADLELGTNGKIAAAALAGGLAFSLLS